MLEINVSFDQSFQREAFNQSLKKIANQTRIAIENLSNIHITYSLMLGQGRKDLTN
jgi:hypothetical protein